MIRLAHRAIALALLGLLVQATAVHGQEKKNLRVVFVSLSWNAQLPFRIASAKGFFKEQGLTVEQIFVRGGPIGDRRAGLRQCRFRQHRRRPSGDSQQSEAARHQHHLFAVELHQLHAHRQQRKQTARRPARQNRRHHRRRHLFRFYHSALSQAQQYRP